MSTFLVFWNLSSWHLLCNLSRLLRLGKADGSCKMLLKLKQLSNLFFTQKIQILKMSFHCYYNRFIFNGFILKIYNTKPSHQFSPSIATTRHHTSQPSHAPTNHTRSTLRHHTAKVSHHSTPSNHQESSLGAHQDPAGFSFRFILESLKMIRFRRLWRRAARNLLWENTRIHVEPVTLTPINRCHTYINENENWNLFDEKMCFGKRPSRFYVWIIRWCSIFAYIVWINTVIWNNTLESLSLI